MIEELKVYAEKRAEQAENLRIFSGIKLLHIKKQVELLLSHIGDYGIFAQYTKHDISHIDEMLKIVDWVIPEQTKQVMTATEWMMLVLSIYFHDMGMLVTKEEYDNRDKTEFLKYKKKVYDGEFGKDYLIKVNSLEAADVFLYQEYVRRNHAKRVRMWVSGELDKSMEYSQKIVDEIQALMAPIDSLFKQDLGMICESHHLNNLDDYSIYDTSKCYESSDEGKVNLQYIAVILRTVDLLHITMDRTPAIEYNVFCPTDPISVMEWQKQMAIRAIKPMEMRNDEGDIDRTIQSNIISVTAYFQEANQAEAFFALMDYLRYVKKELKISYELIQNSIKKQGTANYIFPWKDVDDSGIVTKNFSKNLLKFELDQNSILQMLVGHTLYNDSSVVIRELVQNGLDAVKLQNEIEDKNGSLKTEGKIVVSWNSEEGILSFLDNGTGMTVYDIENYLLKVGTSKYSSPNFKKEHPDFVSISRFGIGILTCFLVANDIEILTCSSENNEANRIFFRNVDGKYLLKNLKTEELPEHIAEHGTIIKLHLRDDEIMKRLEYNIKKWIVFPYCDVLLEINSAEPIKIGYAGPKQALEDYISQGALASTDNILVQEEQIEGVTIAYALRYREYFQEYSLIENNRRNYDIQNEEYPIPIGVCFEGIRIADNTPGYRGDTFLAIMNTSNNKIVRTNVARSSIEENEGKDKLLRIIYSVYKKYVERQIETFKEKGRSLSWISSEIKYLVNQLVGIQNNRINRGLLEKKEIMEDVFGDLNSILFENDEIRQLTSANSLQSKAVINMSESNMINAAEHLLKETKSNISLSGLVNTITDSKTFNSKNMLCDFEQSSILHVIALKGKEASSIHVNREERKIDICFEDTQNNWIRLPLINNDAFEKYETVYIPKEEKVKIQGLSGELGVKTKLGVFLANNNEVTKYICEKLHKFDYENSNVEYYALRLFVSMIVNRQCSYISRDKGQEYFEKSFQNRVEREILERASDNTKDILWKRVDRGELIDILMNQKLTIFDLNDWSIRDR